MSALTERLAVLKDRHGFTFEQLAEILPVTKDKAFNYFSGKTKKVPIPFLKELATYYNEDPDWLISGIGTPPKHVEIKRDLEAQAGLGTEEYDRDQMLWKILGTDLFTLQKGTYRIFRVNGMSMYPSACQNDRLYCRKVSIDEIIDGRIHVIIADRADLNEYRADGVWLKRCYHRKENKYVTCKSDNKDSTEPFYTFQLKRNEIVDVWYPMLRLTGHMADPNRDVYERLDELEARLELIEMEREDNQ